jgi:hypothetical protein
MKFELLGYDVKGFEMAGCALANPPRSLCRLGNFLGSGLLHGSHV